MKGLPLFSRDRVTVVVSVSVEVRQSNTPKQACDFAQGLQQRSCQIRQQQQ
jgi:hypothetical protein